jgi:hypothetical protein
LVLVLLVFCGYKLSAHHVAASIEFTIAMAVGSVIINAVQVLTIITQQATLPPLLTAITSFFQVFMLHIETAAPECHVEMGQTKKMVLMLYGTLLGLCAGFSVVLFTSYIGGDRREGMFRTALKRCGLGTHFYTHIDPLLHPYPLLHTSNAHRLDWEYFLDLGYHARNQLGVARLQRCRWRH